MTVLVHNTVETFVHIKQIKGKGALCQSEEWYLEKVSIEGIKGEMLRVTLFLFCWKLTQFSGILRIEGGMHVGDKYQILGRISVLVGWTGEGSLLMQDASQIL